MRTLEELIRAPDDALVGAKGQAFRLDTSLIADMPSFAGLDRSQQRQALDAAVVRRVEVGDVVFAEGETATHFFALLDGYARIVRSTKEGEQVVMLHVVPGELFGMAKALGREIYPWTARSVTDLIVLAWPSDLWDQFCQEYPSFQDNTRLTMGHRLGEMQDRIIEMSTQKVEQRIAQSVRRLADQAGRATEQGLEIDFPVTRQDISEMTGTTLHSVSRCLSQWQKKGIISGERRRIVLKRPEALPV